MPFPASPLDVHTTQSRRRCRAPQLHPHPNTSPGALVGGRGGCCVPPQLSHPTERGSPTLGWAPPRSGSSRGALAAGKREHFPVSSPWDPPGRFQREHPRDPAAPRNRPDREPGEISRKRKVWPAEPAAAGSAGPGARRRPRRGHALPAGQGADVRCGASQRADSGIQGLRDQGLRCSLLALLPPSLRAQTRPGHISPVCTSCGTAGAGNAGLCREGPRPQRRGRFPPLGGDGEGGTGILTATGVPQNGRHLPGAGKRARDKSSRCGRPRIGICPKSPPAPSWEMPGNAVRAPATRQGRAGHRGSTCPGGNGCLEPGTKRETLPAPKRTPGPLAARHRARDRLVRELPVSHSPGSPLPPPR